MLRKDMCHECMNDLLWLPAATPTDCLLDNSRVLSIATSFGFSIFVLVYVAAAFSGKFDLHCATDKHMPNASDLVQTQTACLYTHLCGVSGTA